MTLELAIKMVIGVTMDDLRDRERTRDRLFGRAIYAKLSGLPRAQIARNLGKVFTSATCYLNLYERLWNTDEEFRSIALEIQSLI